MAKDALIIAALCACLAVACGARTLLAAAPAPAAGGGPVYAACGPTSLAGGWSAADTAGELFGLALDRAAAEAALEGAACDFPDVGAACQQVVAGVRFSFDFSLACSGAEARGYSADVFVGLDDNNTVTALTAEGTA